MNTLKIFTTIIALTTASICSSFALDIFWTNGTGSTVRGANFDGSGVTSLFTFGVIMNEIDLLPSQSLMFVAGTDRVIRANLDGTGVNQFFVTGLTGARGISVDRANELVYYSHDGGLSRINFNGTGNTLISATPAGSESIRVDSANGFVYYTDDGSGQIKRINTNGTGDTVLSSDALYFNPEGIDINPDTGTIYTTNQGTTSNGTVVTSTLLGASPSAIITGALSHGPEDVAVDTINNKIYLTVSTSTSGSTGVIASADLDGSNLNTSFITGEFNDVQGIAVIPEPRTYALLFGLGALLVAAFCKMRRKS